MLVWRGDHFGLVGSARPIALRRSDPVDGDLRDVLRELRGSASWDTCGRIVVPPGIWELPETLDLRRFHGQFWGYGAGNTAGHCSAIRWTGPAGVPVFRLRECWGADIGYMRIIGDPDSPPSAAIDMEVVQTDNLVNSWNHLHDLVIGGGNYIDDPQSGGAGYGFTKGIVTSGYHHNNDQGSIARVALLNIAQCGIEMTGSQNTHWHLYDIIGNNMPVFIRPQEFTEITNLNLSTITDTIFENNQGHDFHVQCRLLDAEGCAMLYKSLAGGDLLIEGGYYQAYLPRTRVDGCLVDIGYGAPGGTSHASLEMRNVSFSESEQPNAWPGPALKIKVRNSKFHGKFTRCHGSWTYPLEDMLDVATTHAGETRTIIVEEQDHNHVGGVTVRGRSWANRWSHGDASGGIDPTRNDVTFASQRVGT